MIIQTFFNKNKDSKLLLNICATIARQNKRVLYIDARFNKTPIKRLSNIYSALTQSDSIEKSIISPELNLDILFGSSKTQELDFLLFSKLVRGDYISKLFKNLDYDYIIIEVSPCVTPLIQNIIHSSYEIGVIYNLDQNQTNYLNSIKSFLKDFSIMYSKQLEISKILPIFSKEVKKQNYINLVNEFSSQIVAYPLEEKVKNKNFQETLLEMSKTVLN